MRAAGATLGVLSCCRRRSPGSNPCGARQAVGRLCHGHPAVAQPLVSISAAKPAACLSRRLHKPLAAHHAGPHEADHLTAGLPSNQQLPSSFTSTPVLVRLRLLWPPPLVQPLLLSRVRLCLWGCGASLCPTAARARSAVLCWAPSHQLHATRKLHACCPTAAGQLPCLLHACLSYSTGCRSAAMAALPAVHCCSGCQCLAGADQAGPAQLESLSLSPGIMHRATAAALRHARHHLGCCLLTCRTPA